MLVGIANTLGQDGRFSTSWWCQYQMVTAGGLNDSLLLLVEESFHGCVENKKPP